MHPVRRRLDRGDAGGVLDGIDIETRRFAQGHRKDGAESMDHVMREQQRDAQARFLDRDALQLARALRAVHAQEGTDPPLAYLLFAACPGTRTGVAAEAGRLVQLTEFFCQRHAA